MLHPARTINHHNHVNHRVKKGRQPHRQSDIILAQQSHKRVKISSGL